MAMFDGLFHITVPVSDFSDCAEFCTINLSLPLITIHMKYRSPVELHPLSDRLPEYILP